MANLASFRSAQGVDRSVHIPVCSGIGDSFHFAEHGQVQLAGWACGTLGSDNAYVVDAGHGQVAVCKRQVADPNPQRFGLRPLSDASEHKFDGAITL